MLLRAPNVISRWHTSFEDFSTSTQDFYARVEENFAHHQVPNVKVSRVEYREGGLFSDRREYLRFSRGVLNCDVCAAPFGRNFFFSTWLTVDFPPYLPNLYFAVTFLSWLFAIGLGLAEGGVLGLLFAWFIHGTVFTGAAFAVRSKELGNELAVRAMPLFGRLYSAFFAPDTYFAQDTENMFNAAVQSAVKRAVDEVTEEGGQRVVSEPSRMPHEVRASA
jgi:hypothetical protein